MSNVFKGHSLLVLYFISAFLTEDLNYTSDVMSYPHIKHVEATPTVSMS